ncbi:hypothetical protein DFH11DRAFT_851797 [Phellopilus nigrolimitatus]|nr:hypothetical protein DFH11DRAFT_851797 [Phellopilus nigrolimitatus]
MKELTFIAALPFAIAAVLSDIVIAASLCYLLQHRKTTFRSTNILLNYLIVYAINRCLLTSVIAVVEVIVFAASPNTYWFLAIDFVIGKCYANSLLATLNSRAALRGKGLSTDGFDPPSLERTTYSGFEVADVTPSMLSSSRSRMTSQNERVSLNFNVPRSSAHETEANELRQPKRETRMHLSAISAEREDSSVKIDECSSDEYKV